MRLKTRLIGIYAILCIVVSCSIASIYYYYNKKAHLTSEYQLLQTYSEQLSNEFDILVEDMNFAITYVLGEEELLDGLKLLVRNMDNPESYTYLKQDALMNIRRILMNNFLNKNFYQTRIFNTNGLMLTKESVLDNLTVYRDEIRNISWIDDVKKRDGESILIGSHTNEWGKDAGVPVISMVKEIRGYEESFIEVQIAVSALEKKMNIREDIRGILIMRNDGEILYCSKNLEEDGNLDELIEAANDAEDKSYYQNHMVAHYTSNKNFITVFTVGDMNQVQDSLLPIRYMAFLIVILIFLIMMLYVNISAGIFEKPVRKLQRMMEITDLESMDQDIGLNSQIKELDALADSYEKLLKRLHKSMIQNKKIEQLHLQAQFDSLQAKISPHFMANILNVISSRGMELGDREICQICGSMASLLRYSTDTREKMHLLRKNCIIWRIIVI